MNLVTDLFPAADEFSDWHVNAALSAVRQALESGDRSNLTNEQRGLVERMDQASTKIASGAELSRISELMSLAQFGAGSIGLAVADACRDDRARQACEALFVTRFLIVAILGAGASANLIPGDLLRRNELDRKDISWPAAKPIYDALLGRATQTLEIAYGNEIGATAPFLRKYIRIQRALAAKHIRKLEGRDPSSRRARLTALDRFLVSLRILLRLEGAP